VTLNLHAQHISVTVDILTTLGAELEITSTPTQQQHQLPRSSLPSGNMSCTNEIIIAFDLYGTLVTPQRARERLVELFGQENAEQVATLWRRYQLEYTWRLNSMGNIQRPCNITITNL
jgi:hypothetical protein